MSPMDRERDALELIVELAAAIDRRLEDFTLTRFLDDRDEIDLTAFRLGHIGEATRRISADTKARHPHVEWTRMVAMRNIISHEYGGILAHLIWKTCMDDVPVVDRICRSELKARTD